MHPAKRTNAPLDSETVDMSGNPPKSWFANNSIIVLG